MHFIAETRDNSYEVPFTTNTLSFEDFGVQAVLIDDTCILDTV